MSTSDKAFMVIWDNSFRVMSFLYSCLSFVFVHYQWRIINRCTANSRKVILGILVDFGAGMPHLNVVVPRVPAQNLGIFSIVLLHMVCWHNKPLMIVHEEQNPNRKNRFQVFFLRKLLGKPIALWHKCSHVRISYIFLSLL